MLIGTILGVIIIPGLYYVFAKMGEGRNMIQGEHHEPMSEEFMRKQEKENNLKSIIKEMSNQLKKLMKREDNE